jgi:hypothetical protein
VKEYFAAEWSRRQHDGAQVDRSGFSEMRTQREATQTPRTAEYRVIGALVFDTELAEQAICKVYLNLGVNPPLGADYNT